MSLHEDVVAAIVREIDKLGDAILLSPTSVAVAVQKHFGKSKAIEPHVQYTSLEHIKQIARSVLAKRFDAEGEESESHQGELFTGQLQKHYPIPRIKGQEPVYKKRESLSTDEVRWNVSQLRRSAAARLAHADALEAWGDGRADAKAAA